jgi:hypothetical protein
MLRRPQPTRSRIIALLCATAFATGVTAAAEPQQGAVELILPRPAAAHEAVRLQIGVALARGARLRVSAGDGTLLGTVSSFGVQRGQDVVTHILPLPATAIVNGRVALRLEVQEPGAAARAPKPGEVDSIALIYVPVTN